jgi:hypothetical protein
MPPRPFPPRWAHIRGRYWSVKIGDISLKPRRKTNRDINFEGERDGGGIVTVSAAMGGGGWDQNKMIAKQECSSSYTMLPLRDQVSTFIKSYAHDQALNKYRL